MKLRVLDCLLKRNGKKLPEELMEECILGEMSSIVHLQISGKNFPKLLIVCQERRIVVNQINYTVTLLLLEVFLKESVLMVH